MDSAVVINDEKAMIKKQKVRNGRKLRQAVTERPSLGSNYNEILMKYSTSRGRRGNNATCSSVLKPDSHTNRTKADSGPAIKSKLTVDTKKLSSIMA